MPASTTLYDFVFGIDMCAGKPRPAWGWVIGPGTPNVTINGTPIANCYDICLSSLGGTGFIISRPRGVFAGGRAVAAQFDWVSGCYQGWVMTSKTPNVNILP